MHAAFTRKMNGIFEESTASHQWLGPQIPSHQAMVSHWFHNTLLSFSVAGPFLKNPWVLMAPDSRLTLSTVARRCIMYWGIVFMISPGNLTWQWKTS